MHHFFVTEDQIQENFIEIEGKDVNHIRNVLRMTPGEELTVSTGTDAREYRCVLTSVDERHVRAQILWVNEKEAELPSRICLYQGLPKSDKMEWIIQKMVELGADEIIPVVTRRTIVKLEGNKARTRIERWNAISESAAKQSKRLRIPAVRPVMKFSEAVADASSRFDKCLIPYERAEGMPHTREIISQLAAGESVAVFIGPEGGFDPEEIEEAKAAGIEPISLGRRILRTETAGMALMSALMIHLEP